MILRSTAALASFALFFTLLPAVQAQTPALDVENSAAETLLRLYADAGMAVFGALGTGAIPATGAGVRLMWHPAKAAFRAGSVDGTQWDDANVSAYSVAMGYNTTASGFASAAMGHSATASGLRALALGSSTTASGFSSLALGNSTTASGNYSAAMGRNTTAQASNSLVAGRYNVIGGDQINWVVTDPLFVVGNGDSNANRSNALTLFKDGGLVVSGALGTGAIPEEGAGARLMWYPAKAAFRVGLVNGTQWDDANVNTYSVALGRNTTASGQYATAMGNGTTASGLASTAMGWVATASGRISAAMGESTTAQAYASLVIGRYNTISGTTDSWVSTEPLFVAGNGSPGSRADALTLLKNGDLTIAGTLTENSDQRLKTAIRPLTGALDAITALQAVRYRFRPDANRPEGDHIGLLAQQVQAVLPELVSEGADGVLSVSYSKLAAVLTAAVGEQQDQIEALRAENDAQQTEIDALRAVNESLAERLARLEALLAETAAAHD